MSVQNILIKFISIHETTNDIKRIQAEEMY